jgi:hypothetical protein
MPLTRPQASILGADTLSNGSVALNVGVPIIENFNVININYCVTTGSNALSAGPLSVLAGTNVTVPTGSVWTII